MTKKQIKDILKDVMFLKGVSKHDQNLASQYLQTSNYSLCYRFESIFFRSLISGDIHTTEYYANEQRLKIVNKHMAKS